MPLAAATFFPSPSPSPSPSPEPEPEPEPESRNTATIALTFPPLALSKATFALRSTQWR